MKTIIIHVETPEGHATFTSHDGRRDGAGEGEITEEIREACHEALDKIDKVL